MIPDYAPFTSKQKVELTTLLAGMNLEQRAWLSGYLSAPSATAGASTSVSNSLTILYGTESGNSEGLASGMMKRAKKQGFKAVLKNLSEISVKDLPKFENVALVVSTWGDGDPPESAEGFYKELMNGAPDLKGMRYSVCALGDTSYDKFCQTGKDFDARFEALGAERVADRVDCDVDFDDAYAGWESKVLDVFGNSGATATKEVSISTTSAVEYGRSHPFPAEVLDHVLLNGKGSAKETVHVEFSLEDSGLEYEAGDALAVVPVNAKDVVDGLLKAGGFDGSEVVELKGQGDFSLREAFTVKLDITGLSRAVVKKYQALANHADLDQLLGDDAKDDFKNWIWGRQIVDLLESYPVEGLRAQDFVNVMRKLPIRLYSIASSPKAHPSEVHLTVAAVRYDGHGKQRKGVASTYLADEAVVGEKVGVYVHKNKNFRLPEDDSKPVIMVGPGTGIAPFRAFIEERDERDAKGDTWLFFGDQRYNFDFLYQLELQDHLKSGALTKLDVAFSRDQPEKVYVQDKMIEKGADIYQWLELGGYFYVCGDAERMAKDVHAALIEIVRVHGDLSEEEAIAYIDGLKKEKRYQRDVY